MSQPRPALRLRRLAGTLILALIGPAIALAQQIEESSPPSPPERPAADEPAERPSSPPETPDKDETEATTDEEAPAAPGATLDELKRQLARPAPDADPQAVRRRLEDIIDRADELAESREPAARRLQARNVQMQALYLRLQRWPDRNDADRDLARLRILARRAKAIDTRGAEAIGDFWLLVGGIQDVHRTGLEPAERRRQIRPLLREYFRNHPDAGPTDAVRAMLDRLDAAAEESDASPNGNGDGDAAAPPNQPANPDASKPKSGNDASDPDAADRPTDRQENGSSNGSGNDPAPSPDGQQDDPRTEPSKASSGSATADPPADSDPPADAERGQTPAAPAFELGEKRTTEAGVIEIPLRSPFQPNANPVRILVPEEIPAREERRYLFVLPVEADDGRTWGDGLTAIRKAGLHERHALIVVAPAFHQTPWYADHPDDPVARQESHLVRAVLPAVDQLYPSEQPTRLLLGFSKSGWGALSLLLRYPDRFHAAAVWDAPLMQEAPDAFGIHKLFPTEARFDRYALPDRLRDRADLLRQRKRIALLGYDHFRDPMSRAHRLLTRLRIPHRYADGPRREHRWDSGWVPEAVRALIDLAP